LPEFALADIFNFLKQSHEVYMPLMHILLKLSLNPGDFFLMHLELEGLDFFLRGRRQLKPRMLEHLGNGWSIGRLYCQHARQEADCLRL